MIAALAFVLECAFLVAVLALPLSVLFLLIFAVLQRTSEGAPAARQANVAFLLGVMPALSTLSLVLAAASPSIASLFGLGADHCLSHRHHLHLCMVHAAGIRPALAAIGSIAIAVFLWRLGRLLLSTHFVYTRVRRLESLARRREGHFPLLLIPGAASLCHSTGVFRRRILLSSVIERALDTDELAVVIAHEEAHLRRHDPLAIFVLRLAALFLPPSIGARFLRTYQAASEEACDVEAAQGDSHRLYVASALVKVAGLRRSVDVHAPLPAAGFGEADFQQRINRLLSEEPLERSRAWALSISTVAAFVIIALALLNAAQVHHAIETILHRLS